MIQVDAASFLVIVTVAAVASLAVTLLSPRIALPVVVVELVLGIIVGPQVLDVANLDASTEFFGNLGLGMLFFFAGYEIDFERIRGQPMIRAGIGWIFSWGSHTRLPEGWLPRASLSLASTRAPRWRLRRSEH